MHIASTLSYKAMVFVALTGAAVKFTFGTEDRSRGTEMVLPAISVGIISASRVAGPDF